MFINAIPPGALEILLFLALFAAFVFVVARVARRNAYIPDTDGIEEVEPLVTPLRTDVQIRRILRDGDSAVADALAGGQTVSMILADFSSRADSYRSALKSKTAIALYALATIQSMERVGEAVNSPGDDGSGAFSLMHSGPLRNDYALFGQVRAVRNGEIDGVKVNIYRFENPAGFAFDAAVEAVPDTAPLGVGERIGGTARLYGYLPQDEEVAD